MVNYKKLGFFGKFLELNKVMWTTNAGLTESHPYDSRPSSWPWMRRGISFWGREQKHIYLIGNWFTWYLSSAAVVFYVTMRLLFFVRDKRGYRDDFNGKKKSASATVPDDTRILNIHRCCIVDLFLYSGLREYYELSGGFFFMGWCYHYLPFFLMGRQLFLHHYLPALYFAILLFSVTFDLICRFMPNKFRLVLLLLVSSTAIYVFRMRAPLTYGSEWTQSLCEASKVLRTWDYDCNQYPQSLSQYRTSSASSSPSTPIVAEEVKIAESVEHDKGVLADLVSDQGEDSKAAGAAQAQVIRGVEVGEDTGRVQDDSVASGGDGAQVTDQAAAKENGESLSSEGDGSK